MLTLTNVSGGYSGRPIPSKVSISVLVIGIKVIALDHRGSSATSLSDLSLYAEAICAAAWRL